MYIQASNSLPSQDILASIVTAIFSHLTSKVAAFPTVEMSVKILVSLCQHDNGMVHMIKYVLPVAMSVCIFSCSLCCLLCLCMCVCMCVCVPLTCSN